MQLPWVRSQGNVNQEFHFYQTQNLQVLSFEAEVSKAHGRIDQRRIEAIEVSDKYFGGLDTIKQIARIHRKYYTLKTKKQVVETHYIMRGKFNELLKSEKYLCKPLKPSASVLKIIYS